LAVLIALVALATFAAPALASFGFQSGSFENVFTDENGLPDALAPAGSHPFAMTTVFKFKTLETGGLLVPDGDVKDIVVNLPAGLVGNPTATPRCTIEQFNTRNPRLSQGFSGAGCPNETQVGIAGIELNVPEEEAATQYYGIYNLVAPPGVPAEFGINPIGVPIILTPKVRTGTDYGVNVASRNTNQSLRVYSVKTIFWGVPADSSHDALRGECMGLGGQPLGGTCPVGTQRRPFLTLPTSCSQEPLVTTIVADSWQHPGEFVPPQEAFDHDAEGHHLLLTGCEHLDFSPTVNVQPDTHAAGSPTGLHVDVSLPQNENPIGLAEADLKKAVVTLPAGVSISPSAANGLQTCTDIPEPATATEPARPEGEIALHSDEPVRCPDASKVGTVEIETPLLEAPLEGSVYVASEHANPFDSLLALYVVAKGSGVLIKLAGKVEANPTTGQLTTVFAGNPPLEGTPQQPFSHLRLHLFGGPRAALMTPRACGAYEVGGALTPWSGGPPAPISQLLAVSGECGEGFNPAFDAGTVSNQAGSTSAFGFTLSRSGQEQAFSQLSVRLPAGLAGNIANIPLCGEAQANAGTCPEASQIGHVIVSAGAGSNPIFLPEPGRPQIPVYLTGPYNGAPFGLSVVVPAEAGPFKLGPPVIVRSAVHIDPRTAQVTIDSSAFPTIIEGIPVDVRMIQVVADHEGFTFNPTSCAPSQVQATVLSDRGATAHLSSRFQAANCATLPFKPKFSASTAAHPSHAKGASLNVKVAYPQGTQANIATVKVSLPKQLPSRLTTLQHACPEAAFLANPATCPPESNVGTATATTPVLNVPLTGPAYLVSHGGAAFPDLIIVLQGQGVLVELVGNTNISKASITTSTFAAVPDVPVSSFELKLPQGPHSALTENLPRKSKGNFCSTKLLMPTTILGQNGARIQQSTKIAVTGCPRAKKKTRSRGAASTGHGLA
jgi:hypothetical protein